MTVHSRVRDTAVAMGAPALVGACLGVSFGVVAMLKAIAGLPAVFIGVGLLMAPALYIAAAFLGVAPAASEMTRAAGRTFKDAGIIMLGLTPALAFLVATTRSPGTVLALAHVVVGVTALLTLVVLYRRVFQKSDAESEVPKFRIPVLYFCWSTVSLGLGWRLLLSVFAA